MRAFPATKSRRRWLDAVITTPWFIMRRQWRGRRYASFLKYFWFITRPSCTHSQIWTRTYAFQVNWFKCTMATAIYFRPDSISLYVELFPPPKCRNSSIETRLHMTPLTMIRYRNWRLVGNRTAPVQYWSQWKTVREWLIADVVSRSVQGVVI